jgi:phage baseplate assembly protein W
MTKIGFSFPMAIVRGSVAISSDLDLVRESILELLLTRIGERVMRNNYGTEELLFDDRINNLTLTKAIYDNIDNVSNVRVSNSIDDDGKVNLNIYYTYSNQPETLLII